MNQKIKKTKPISKNSNVALLKDDDLRPKGRTKHVVETDWPIQEVRTSPHKKRIIKKTATARLP